MPLTASAPSTATVEGTCDRLPVPQLVSLSSPKLDTPATSSPSIFDCLCRRPAAPAASASKAPAAAAAVEAAAPAAPALSPDALRAKVNGLLTQFLKVDKDLGEASLSFKVRRAPAQICVPANFHAGAPPELASGMVCQLAAIDVQGT